jgi:putative nucleotidyltransferase with HDIG domain
MKNAQILIVDDQQANVRVLERLLAREGYTNLKSTTDARQALPLFSEFQPDLILLDLLMPYLDGFAVLEQLRPVIPADSYLPILVLTADITPEAKQRALSNGAKDFLTKPIDAVEVSLRIRNLLETRWLQLRLQNQNQILEEKVRERTAELTQANVELWHSEVKNHAILNAIPDLMFRIRQDGIYLDFKAARPEDLYVPPGEFLGKKVSEVLPEETVHLFRHAVGRALQTGEIQIFEYQLTQAGDRHDYEARIVVSGEGEALAIVRNITQRKQAEERIRRETGRTAALLRTANRLNTRIDLDMVLRAVCEETARALNVPATAVALYDEQRQVFDVAADFGLPQAYRERASPMPPALYDDYTRQGGPLVVVPDVQAQPGLPDRDLYVALNMRTMVSVSMQRDEQLVGTLSLITFGEVRHFTEDELDLLKGLADQAAQAITNAHLFVETEMRLERLRSLHDIDRAITNSLDLRLTLKVFLDKVTHQLRVDAAAVFLFNAASQTLTYAAGQGFHTHGLQLIRLRLGEGYAGRAALDRRTVSIPDVSQSQGEPAFARFLGDEAFVAYYGVPLLAKGQITGVLELYHRAPLSPGDEWLNFLETLAGQAAIAIENAALFEGLQRSHTDLTLAYDTTLEGWSSALDLRDRETEGHTQRVAEMTLRLARAMGFTEAELVHVRRGALLHDIGKMGIPDQILLKPGTLTDDEWVIMRKHPIYAYELLSPIAYLRPALDIPYSHHEKWNGMGYPRGLQGEQIPLSARLFAVVDVWDALRSDRPYRPGWPEEKVREYLRAGRGVHFEPQMVDVFLRELNEAG